MNDKQRKAMFAKKNSGQAPRKQPAGKPRKIEPASSPDFDPTLLGKPHKTVDDLGSVYWQASDGSWLHAPQHRDGSWRPDEVSEVDFDRLDMELILELSNHGIQDPNDAQYLTPGDQFDDAIAADAEGRKHAQALTEGFGANWNERDAARVVRENYGHLNQADQKLVADAIMEHYPDEPDDYEDAHDQGFHDTHSNVDCPRCKALFRD